MEQSFLAVPGTTTMVVQVDRKGNIRVTMLVKLDTWQKQSYLEKNHMKKSLIIAYI
jgi:hypothetical protein